MLEIGQCDLVHEVEIVLEHATRTVVADTVVVETRHCHEALVALGGIIEAKSELIDLHLDDVERPVETCLKFIQNVVKGGSDGNNLACELSLVKLLEQESAQGHELAKCTQFVLLETRTNI